MNHDAMLQANASVIAGALIFVTITAITGVAGSGLTIGLTSTIVFWFSASSIFIISKKNKKKIFFFLPPNGFQGLDLHT
jgi:hypothetical protein